MEPHDGFIRGDGIPGMVGKLQDRAFDVDQLRLVQDQSHVRSDIAYYGKRGRSTGDRNIFFIVCSEEVPVQGNGGLFALQHEVAARSAARDGHVQIRETADGSVIGRTFNLDGQKCASIEAERLDARRTEVDTARVLQHGDQFKEIVPRAECQFLIHADFRLNVPGDHDDVVSAAGLNRGGKRGICHSQGVVAATKHKRQIRLVRDDQRVFDQDGVVSRVGEDVALWLQHGHGRALDDQDVVVLGQLVVGSKRNVGCDGTGYAHGHFFSPEAVRSRSRTVRANYIRLSGFSRPSRYLRV